LKKAAILGKRQIVLGILILALAAAVYLNWQFASADGGLNISDTASSESANLGESVFVNNADAEQTSSELPYFSDARKERAEAREKALDELKEIVDNAKSDESAKKAAGEKSVKIAANTESESAIETLVKAKGFADCIAVISDDSISVVVQGSDLLGSQIMQIKDIINSQIQIADENIKIINVN
jgi:stage III sporulation protein AH